MTLKKSKRGFFYYGKEFFGALTIEQCTAVYFLEHDKFGKMDFIEKVLKSKKYILAYYGI